MGIARLVVSSGRYPAETSKEKKTTDEVQNMARFPTLRGRPEMTPRPIVYREWEGVQCPARLLLLTVQTYRLKPTDKIMIFRHFRRDRTLLSRVTKELQIARWILLVVVVVVDGRATRS
jgi:hypothetical protein